MLEIIVLCIFGYCYPVFFEKLNRIRGEKYKPKWCPMKLVAYAYMSLLVFLPVIFLAPEHNPIAYYLLLLSQFFLCFQGLGGWGKYFPHGRNNSGPEWLFKEKEFFPADFIANKTVGKWDSLRPTAFVKDWQTRAMTARWVITFGIILFGGLAVFLHNPLPALGAIGMFKVGKIYRKESDKAQSKQGIYAATATPTIAESRAIETAELKVGELLGYCLIPTLLGAYWGTIW